MKIEWNKVTWYSKLIAVIVFVGTFALAFWLGTLHERPQDQVLFEPRIPAELQVTTSEREPRLLPFGLEIKADTATFKGDIIRGANPNTLSVYEDLSESPHPRDGYGLCHVCYVYDEDQVWFYSSDDLDGNHFFNELENTTIDKLERVVIQGYTDTALNNAYAVKDSSSNRIFVYGNELSDINENQLQRVEEDSFFISDGERVYTIYGELIPGVDVPTFEVINWYFAKDRKSVYYRTYRSVKRATFLDSASFEIINEVYVKDSDSVAYIHSGGCDAVFEPREIVDVDVETFEPVNDNPYAAYAKDKNNVYIGEKTAENGDPETLEVTPEGIVRDQNNTYSDSGVIRQGC